jgi:hypothetical protein
MAFAYVGMAPGVAREGGAQIIDRHAIEAVSGFIQCQRRANEENLPPVMLDDAAVYDAGVLEW